MNRKWMNKTLLALSIQMAVGVVYAAEAPALGEYETVDEVESATPALTNQSMGVEAQKQIREDAQAVNAQNVSTAAIEKPVDEQRSQASSALQQQDGDASKEANLQEVFTSNERQYSLIKKGDISSFYDIDYTYYRDTQIDAEMAKGQLYQLRVQENAVVFQKVCWH